MKHLVIASALILGLLGGAVRAEAAKKGAKGKPTVAVVAIETSSSVAATLITKIEAAITAGLLDSGYAVRGRDEVIKVIAAFPELARCRRGLCLERMGELLEVDFVVIGSVEREDDDYKTRMRLVAAKAPDIEVEGVDACVMCPFARVPERITLVVRSLRVKMEEIVPSDTTDDPVVDTGTPAVVVDTTPTAAPRKKRKSKWWLWTGLAVVVAGGAAAAVTVVLLTGRDPAIPDASIGVIDAR